MKKIVLIQPPFERLMGYYRYYTNPGLLSLAAVINEAGHEVVVYDADYNPEGKSYNTLEMLDNYNRYVYEMENHSDEIWDEIRDFIEEFKPDFVGISVLTPTLASSKYIIDIVRSVNSNIKIIAGGVHATILPNDLVDYVDYVIQYEGEGVINKIIEGEIKEKITVGPRIKDLDKLPFPDVSKLYNLQKFTQRDLSLVMSTRGCPFACKFCGSPKLWGRKITRKSVNYFINEIVDLKNNYGVNDFYISDDSFSVDNKWLNEFCCKVKDFNVTWRCLDRVDSVTKEKIEMMKDAGCRNIKIGIESGSQKILNAMNKHITIESVLKADKIFKDSDMDWSAFFMIGFPGETEDDIRKTQELIKTISAKSITLSIYTPYPYDDLYSIDKLDYKKYSHHSPNNNFTGTISDEIFEELLVETLKLCEKNYNEHS